MISIEDVQFGDAGYQLDGDSPDGGARYWTSAEGDQVGLYLFPLQPDIGADLTNIEALRAFYRTTASRNNLGVLEIEVFDAGGARAVRSLLKAGHGLYQRNYIGAITLPFRDFSFVFRVQCNEDGVAGAREAAVLDLLVAKGEVTPDFAGRSPRGWLCDPYEPSLTGPQVCNRADLEVYDAMFPAHALSRARRTLAHFQRTMRLSPDLRGEPPFVYSGA